MAAVTVAIQSIANQNLPGNNSQQNPVQLVGDGPWAVAGAAEVAEGRTLQSLTYEIVPETPQGLNPGQAWIFALTTADHPVGIPALDTTYELVVTATDDESDANSATAWVRRVAN